MSLHTFERLIRLLDAHQARYRVVHHSSAGKTEEVARVRGTAHGQGAKALVCHVKGNGIRCHVLAVLPADCQADPLLFDRFDELAFNAGVLERSLILATEDYRRIAAPRLVPFARHP